MPSAARDPDDDPFVVPDAIAALGPDAADCARRLVHEARDRQSTEIETSLERALHVVPRPARTIVRRIVLG
ncbi:MAG: hypothetical protein AB7G37_02830 [Solirubrobacteraceae bacterium]